MFVRDARKSAGAAWPRRRSGRVINIASILGLVGGGDPGQAGDHRACNTTKGGVDQLHRASLAAEWAQYNINVNAIAPGLLPDQDDQGACMEMMGEAVRPCAPLKRMGGPEDLKGLTVLLGLRRGRVHHRAGRRGRRRRDRRLMRGAQATQGQAMSNYDDFRGYACGRRGASLRRRRARALSDVRMCQASRARSRSSNSRAGSPTRRYLLRAAASVRPAPQAAGQAAAVGARGRSRVPRDHARWRQRRSRSARTYCLCADESVIGTLVLS